MIKYIFEKKLRPTDCLIFPVWQDSALEAPLRETDRELGGHGAMILHTKDFTGKRLQTAFVYPENQPTPRLLLVGLGEAKNFSVRAWKCAIGTAIIQAQGKKAGHIAIMTPPSVAANLGFKKLGSATAIAMATASYSYDEYKTDPEAKAIPIEEVQWLGEYPANDRRALEKGLEEGILMADAINFARHLGNIPPTIMTPTLLANEAVDLAKRQKVKTTVLSREEMKKLGMGCLLAVSWGSIEEPKFIIVEYLGGPKNQKPTVLAGKGITYDSGGLTIKPMEHLLNMKFDMLGAATVLATIQAAASLGLKKNIIGLIPSCENMPGGEAYRPDDILVAMNGKSVEVGNTDAEGRLILADALAYAQRLNPKEVIDLATLTGACMVALGTERSGLFTPEDGLASKLISSAEAVGECLWRLPLGEEFSEAIKSDVADIKNFGGVDRPYYGGASTGAAFLQFFTDYPWAHIDMSCCYYPAKSRSWIRGGANGWGVETMVEYLNT
ncbi:MAG: leucyl aminopeptidase [Candidatus Magasanikbacteria bacterium]|nr:leucyl aminopeptidase [Candidatus Magasanikbacteria bacterium]